MKKNLQTELYRVIKDINISLLDEHDKMDLLSVFKNTNNHALRDLIALYFEELQFNEASPYIISKINDPQLVNHTSTLVFSLKSLDLQPMFFIDIIRLFCRSKYSSQLSSVDVIEKLLPVVSASDIRLGLSMLEDYRNELLKGTESPENKAVLSLTEQTISLIKKLIKEV